VALYDKHRDDSDLASLIPRPAAETPPPPPLPLPQAPDNSFLSALAEFLQRHGVLGQGQAVPMPSEPVVGLPDPEELLVRPERKYERVLVIGDAHYPFQDKAAVAAMLEFARDWKPDLFLLNGDIFDCADISDHERNPKRMPTLQEEFDSAVEDFRAIDSLGSDVFYIIGNHEERLQRLVSRNPGLFNLRSLDFGVAANLPKRWRLFPDQTHIKIGGLLYLHGNLKGRGGGARHVASSFLQKLRHSCLFNHWHRFQSFWEADYDGLPRAGFGNGHMTSVPSHTYIRTPDWQTGFSTIEYDHGEGIFSVGQRLICNGALRADGRTYKG